MVKLIQKISSLVAKTEAVFHHRKKKLNASSARKIQQSAFAKGNILNDDKTPPYKLIAEQLSSPHDQVFDSAVYHLAKIANSSQKYHSAITAILNEYASNPHLSEHRKQYIAQKLSELTE